MKSFAFRNERSFKAKKYRPIYDHVVVGYA